jgi:hypothetical protein
VIDERIDIVKIDVQGAEQHAVQGMEKIIERSRPTMIVEFDPQAIVQNGEDPYDVVSFYKRFGFDIRIMGLPGLEANLSADQLIEAVARAPSAHLNLLLTPVP